MTCNNIFKANENITSKAKSIIKKIKFFQNKTSKIDLREQSIILLLNILASYLFKQLHLELQIFFSLRHLHLSDLQLVLH